MNLKTSLMENEEIDQLVKLIKNLNAKDHNPATSGNYSIRLNSNFEIALVSESGIDKEYFESKHFIPIHIASGEAHHKNEYLGRKSSDETLIHLAIYNSTEAKCILHSHKLEALLFADLFSSDSATLGGLELLKGLKGIKSHDVKIQVPLFNNSQDMQTFSTEIATRLSEERSAGHALIIRGHGFYVWGDNVLSTKRHLEVYEYLFKYYLEKKLLGV